MKDEVMLEGVFLTQLSILYQKYPRLLLVGWIEEWL